MKDEVKIEQQHTNELAALRQRIAELQESETERKQAEKALQDSEAKYRAVVNQSPDPIFLVDIDARKMLEANPALERLLGYSHEELKTLTLYDFVAHDKKDIDQRIRRIMKNRTSFLGERCYRRKDGTLLYVEVSVSIISYRGKEVMCVVSRNITERKFAEEELGRQKAQLDEVFNSVQEGIGIVDENEDIVFCNPAFAKIFEDDSDHLVGKNLLEFFPNETHSLIFQQTEERQAGKTSTYELPLLTSAGIRKYIRVTASPRIGEDGAYKWAFGGILDITERKKAEEKLRESEERFRDLSENANDLIQSVTPDGKFLYVNRAWRETLGYSEEEIAELSLFDIIHPDSQAHCLEVFQQVISGGKIDSAEAVFVAKDGRRILVEGSANCRFKDGKPFSTRGIFRDITERKKMEEELRQSLEKLRTNYEATVSALASAFEMRDTYTAGHQRRVTKVACAIAKEMDLPQDQIEGLRLAGLVHDIGKIKVPAEILTKPNRLTETEFNIIKSHPQVGYEILKTIDFPWPVAQMVLQHHERMDGSGYPAGLAGEDILLTARILAVADVMEALSSHRPYRQALGREKALEELSHNRGVRYYPQVVDACLKLFTEKGFEFE